MLILRQFISFALALQLVFVIFPARINAADSPREIRLAVFDEVWQTIRDRYYDPKLRGIDWRREREKYRPLAEKAVSQTEFYKILRQMLGDLRDSHTRVFAPEEKSEWHKPRIISVGISVREIESELIIVKVEKNSHAEQSGVRVGDVLTEIDGTAAKSFFAQRVAEQTGASTIVAGRFRAAYRLFDGADDSTVKIRWRDAKGKEKSAELRRERQTITPALHVRRTKNVLVIGFDAFTPETIQVLFQVLHANQKDLRGIVIDLRSNRGGAAEAAIDLISAFLPRATAIGKFIDRDGRIAIDARTRQSSFFAANFINLPSAPMVILTGAQTASAAEIFAATLQQNKRARIIGTATCGCVLAVKTQHTLPDGGGLDVSELDFKTPGGSRLEAAGVVPDERIETLIRDVRSGRDRQLERALGQFKTD